MNIKEKYKRLLVKLGHNITLVGVIKMRVLDEIKELYEAGCRDFGENKVQEILKKRPLFPDDVRWHFIGHLQTNKVKQIIPFIYLIHSVDSLKLLKEIDKQAKKHGRIIEVLIQVKIAIEDSKYGISIDMLEEILSYPVSNLKIKGFMGMATFTKNQNQISEEFNKLKYIFNNYKKQFPNLTLLSMGMTNDYKLAVQLGSNMVRIGSLLFR